MKEIKIHPRSLRKNRSLSQEQLAEALGVSRQAIISLESGESLPSLPLFCEMIDFFQEPLESLIEAPNLISINNSNNNIGGNMKRELGPWSPIHDISTLHDMIDKMFEDHSSSFKPEAMIPSINVHETQTELVIESHLPGVEEKDLNVEVEEDMVTISGERKEEETDKNKNYFRKEIKYGSFIRQIPISLPIKVDEADANLKDGVLKVTLPKTEPTQPKIRKITVKKK